MRLNFRTESDNQEEEKSAGFGKGDTASLKEKRLEKKSKKGKSKNGHEEIDSEKYGEFLTAEKMLKKKLNEVLQEGIMDSVLPYLLPKQEQQQQFSILQPPIKKFLLSGGKYHVDIDSLHFFIVLIV